jgi:hypothetical protein
MLEITSRLIAATVAIVPFAMNASTVSVAASVLMIA